MSDNLDKTYKELSAGIQSENYYSLAKSISLCEKDIQTAFLLVRQLDTNITRSRSKVIGITGAPSVGKSAVIDNVASSLLSRGNKIAVLSIDPTLQKCDGAFLSDRY